MYLNSVDEIALIDVPAMLQLVSYHSGHRGKIIYVGHSLGTTAAIMYSSEHPDHARQTVQLFIWISPAYKLTHMRSPYRLLFPLMMTALVSDYANIKLRKEQRFCFIEVLECTKRSASNLQGTLQQTNTTDLFGISTFDAGLFESPESLFGTIHTNCSSKLLVRCCI